MSIQADPVCQTLHSARNVDGLFQQKSLPSPLDRGMGRLVVLLKTVALDDLRAKRTANDQSTFLGTVNGQRDDALAGETLRAEWSGARPYHLLGSASLW